MDLNRIIRSSISTPVGSYYNKQGGYEEYKEDCTMVNAKYASLYNKGPMAQTELSNYLKQREGVGHTIMNADKVIKPV